MFALFNSENQLIGYSDDLPDNPSYNIFKIKLPDDKTDLLKWRWEGDMFNGKMVKILVENSNE